jgi:hypothetical protein
MLSSAGERRFDRKFFEYLAKTLNFTTQIGDFFLYLNKNTLHYDKNENIMYIFHLDATVNPIKFFLTSVNMKFTELAKPSTQSSDVFYKTLISTYTKTQEIIISDQKEGELINMIPERSFRTLSQSGEQNPVPSVKFSLTSDPNKLPLNFLKSAESKHALIHSSDKIFTIEIDREAPYLPARELRDLKVRDKENITQVKWHPELSTHVGVLTSSIFTIYNLESRVQEFNFPFPSLRESNEVECHAVDFNFFTYTRIEDFRRLSVMFMNARGQFFFYSPIFLSGLTLNANEWEGLSKSINELYYAVNIDRKYLKNIFETTKNELSISSTQPLIDDSSTIVIGRTTLGDERITNTHNSLQG